MQDFRYNGHNELRGVKYVAWWSEPVSRWAAALCIDYIEEDMSIDENDDEIGRWVHGRNGWTLRVEAATVLRFPEWDGTDALRDALAWTIEHTRPLRQTDEEALVALYQQLCWNSVRSLAAMARRSEGQRVDSEWRSVSVAPEATIGPSLHVTYPGYLILVESRMAGHPEGKASPEGWEHVVPDVIAATIGDVWWRPLGSDGNFLFYASHLQMEEAFADVVEADSGEAVPDAIAKLKHMANLLTTAIVEDALLDAKITISRRLQAPSDFIEAFASAVLVSRLPRKVPTAAEVYGDTPFAMWMALASKDAMQSFVDMITERAQVGTDDWPQHWIELVNGVIGANLNVSEAARSLFVHRNTLLNRIERLHEVTGFDVRQVQDAMVLYFTGLIVTQQIA